MDVVVSTEARFDQTPDGAIWTRSPYVRAWWNRYLHAFDRVRVLARVRSTPAVDGEWSRADGDAVSFIAVPHYVGPYEYARRALEIRRVMRGALKKTDAVIMRVGSPLANCLEPLLRRAGRPYALEVIGDPYDVFAPGVVEHPFRPFFRWWFHRSLVRQCRNASAVAYVTECTLQRRYPAGAQHTSISDVQIAGESFAREGRPLVTFYSSVDLDAAAYGRLHQIDAVNEPNIVFVGSLDQLYKGPDVLIDAVALCHQAGVKLRLSRANDSPAICTSDIDVCCAPAG